MHSPVLKISEKDNLLVALKDIPQGEVVHYANEQIHVANAVKAKHKMALQDFSKDDILYLYGVPVGRALESIPKGGAITTQNVVHAAGEVGNRKELSWEEPEVTAFKGRTFKGYVRKDGRVGTANNWIVIPLVFCQNRNVRVIREAFLKQLGYDTTNKYESMVSVLVEMYKAGKTTAEIEAYSRTQESTSSQPKLFPNIDGIRFLTHESGCGGTDEDSDVLCRLLASYACHPNVAGVTVLSLGCQKAQINLLKAKVHELNPDLDKPLLCFEQQRYTSEEELLDDAIKATFTGLMEANKTEREDVPVSKLVIGVECGGSDGFSGISANPCIGKTADMLVSLGGSVILSEFPELVGVEQEVVDRCISDDVAARFVGLMNRYQDAAEAVGSSMDNNPSPGNIKDGLITDAMKSAGAAKKGGSSPVVDVQDYPGYVTESGLTLLNTPGNDVESTTGLAGAGANLILFSTGLGTPTGNPITPTLKISSNSILARKMSDIIDFDSGQIINGELSLEQAASALLEKCIAIASGNEKCKAEILGQEDFIPWKRGVSL
ncbi:MAG: altronate dehydratase family protein [Lentisphaeraceae bacterium]|nr:altronate dehydratase family protein [Lentisphaeraceae bacterium]